MAKSKETFSYIEDHQQSSFPKRISLSEETSHPSHEEAIQQDEKVSSRDSGLHSEKDQHTPSMADQQPHSDRDQHPQTENRSFRGCALLLFFAIPVVILAVASSPRFLPSQYYGIKKRAEYALENLHRFESDNQRISIFVIGKSGSGKSTLIDALFGLSEEEMQTRRQVSTSPTISTEERSINGVDVTVYKWGSPENQRTELDNDLVSKIHQVNFVLFSVRMDDTRLRPGDKSITRKLGKIFGNNIWEKTVIALTYANRVDFIDSDGMLKKTKEHLQKIIQEWTSGLHEILEEEKIPHATIKNIPVVPTGYYKNPVLYNELWMEVLVRKCLSRVTTSKPLVRKALKKGK